MIQEINTFALWLIALCLKNHRLHIASVYKKYNHRANTDGDANPDSRVKSLYRNKKV